MKRLLKKTVDMLFHFVDGAKFYGLHKKLLGDCSGLRGDCSGLRGDLGACEIDRTGITRIEDLVE